MTLHAGDRLPLPGTGAALMRRVEAVAAAARASGALQPIATRVEFLADSGIEYGLRVVEQLRRKRSDTRTAPANPFLPYDPALYVGHLPPRHVLLLNKYNVIEPHLLAVTETFEPQSAALDAGDFAAACALLGRLDGLVFYNGGRRAGASQPHKHLQWVPSALWPGATGLPVDAPIRRALDARSRPAVADLPFEHALSACGPVASASALHEAYVELLQRIGRAPRQPGTPCEDYNLLLTRRWMMAVPRSREDWEGIGINALGFAGALLVRDEAQAALARSIGPSAILEAVTRCR